MAARKSGYLDFALSSGSKSGRGGRILTPRVTAVNEELIFTAAVEKGTQAERSAFLAEACGGDEALRRRLEALLESHEQTEFLRTSAVERAAMAFREEATARVTDTSIEHDPESPISFLAPSDQPGSIGRLAHYEILEVIGRGGMGVVLRALDEKLHRIVAIKVMAAELATSTTARRRFAREAQAAAAVSHDHIVTIHGVEEADGLPYLVMQYVAGMSLQDRLVGRGPLPLPEILRIGMQTASGLAAAHAQGLIHRDIKPANILLENGVERVKITDFGLARAVDDASLTHGNVVAGTPQYMAPEQARGEPMDQRADLFSLGSVLYAMCTGRAPFCASGTMAVLKRVCEESPGSIRAANPDIPEWLVAIIAKLQTKDPAGRYQSAAEVADLLEQCLRHVQQPLTVPLPASAMLSRLANSRGRRRWMAVAAGLLAIFIGFGLSEASGVTHLAQIAVRILTPDGTLVVETNDPAVVVTIESDGGLVITGAGPQEVRLRPGSYRLSAARDGLPVPLDRDVVTISHNDRQTVKIRIEGPAGDGLAHADGIVAERPAFVVLGGEQVPARPHATLAEAVAIALDGDTIEIRSNGPFYSPPIVIDKSLTIRAGAGFCPVLNFAGGEPGDDLLIAAHKPLVLEGLDIRELAKPRSKSPHSGRYIIYCDGDSLHLANCRIVREGRFDEGIGVVAAHARVSIRNCMLAISGGSLVSFGNDAPVQFVMQNCALSGWSMANYLNFSFPNHDIQITWNRNTLAVPAACVMGLGVALERDEQGAAIRRISFTANDNIFDVRKCMVELLGHGFQENAITPEDAQVLLRSLTNWRGRRNLYSPLPAFVRWKLDEVVVAGNLEEWREFWNRSDPDSQIGTIRFQGGDLLTRTVNAPKTIRPADFRLRPDSAGYCAGPDGEDLGADVDFVGPGAAYERWKKTPEYQQWLVESGQHLTSVDRVSQPAFVILGGTGVGERRFPTLAEAVLNCADGDTVEIRGNGPFSIQPINISEHSLRIRAGAGFQPVIIQSEDVPANSHLLTTDANLVLEGLEFRRPGDGPVGNPGSGPFLVYSAGRSLGIANCRFLTSSHSLFRNDILGLDADRNFMRNCEFISPTGIPLSSHFGESKTFVLENSVLIGRYLADWWIPSPPKPQGDHVRLGHNSFVAAQNPAIYVGCPAAIRPLLESNLTGLVQVDADANLFDSDYVLHLGRHDWQLGTEDEDHLLFKKLFDWSESDNFYLKQRGFLGASDDEQNRNLNIATTDEWTSFWGNKRAHVHEGTIRYQGGDLVTKLIESPDSLTASDFRLRPDSAGYRAGPDGKDLGADVDFVGPGPAYQRWKQTRDYQEWLEETLPIPH